MIEFEWDPGRAEMNLRKHGVGFVEAAAILRDPLSITIFDPDHSRDEDRYITVGMSSGGRTRIISARELTRAERREYEEEIQRRAK